MVGDAELPSHGFVLDHHTWTFDLSQVPEAVELISKIDLLQVSSHEEEPPVWRHLYSASTDLGLKGIAPQDWIEVLETQKLLHCGDRLWQNGSIWTFHIFTFHISTSLHCVMEVLDRATKDDLLFEQMVRFYNQNRFFSSSFFCNYICSKKML